MKKILLILLGLIGILVVFVFSCTKPLNGPLKHQVIQNASEIKPLVDQCDSGYHWDFTLNKCVPDDCKSGYHWDNNRRECVFTTIRVIANTNNPYDSAGSRHNAALNYTWHNVSYSTSSAKITQLILNYLGPFGYDTNELKRDIFLSDSLGISGFDDVDSLAYKLFSMGQIGSAAESYMLDLGALINNVIGSSDPNDSIYIVFADDAITYENEIKNDNSLSSNEKIVLLEEYAIGRYSPAFWGNLSSSILKKRMV